MNEMSENRRNSEVRDAGFQLLGWILFVVCAICFIASSVKNHDFYTFFGSVVFLMACVIFLIPLAERYQYLKNLKHSDTRETTPLD